MRRSGLLSVTVVAVLLLAPTAVAVAQTHKQGPAGSLTIPGALRGLAAVNAHDIWAVGTADGKTRETSLIVRWNGRQWKRVAAPGAGLNSVAATSARSAWAVGSASGKTLILRWNGTAWKQVPSPAPSGAGLSAVTATSASNAWAVGSTSRNKTLILHWNGTVWSRVPSPSPSSISLLSAVSATSGRNAWAVGGLTAGHRGTFILHWNGTAWKRAASPRFPAGTMFDSLDGVAASSPHNAWAVGSASGGVDPYSARTIVLHWNGTSWKRVASANRPSGGSYLSGVTASPARSAWAVGVNMYEASPPNPNRYHLLVEHWNGAAWRFTRTSLPAYSFLAAVAATSARSAWAVGSTGQTMTLILHWNGRTWS